VSPDRGLYTAIVAGFIISALGGSRVQIGGPTGAFVVIVYGIIQKYGYDGLAVATVLAGIFLIVIGAVRLGAVIKFIPHPVVVGFTSGIAIIIFSNEVKDLLGLKMGTVPADFVEKWRALAHMSEWRSFVAELTAPKSDVVVLLATFLLTVIVDLTVAIEVGMVAAAFLFMRRMAEVANVSSVTIELEDGGDQYSTDPNAVSRRSVPPGVEVFEVNGPFFFGVAETFKDTVGQVAKKPRVLVIRLRNVPSIDSSGMHALKDVVHRTRKDGTLVLVSDVHTQPLVAIGRSAVLEEIGEDNLFGNIDDALDRAREYLGLPHTARPPASTPTVARETPGRSSAVR